MIASSSGRGRTLGIAGPEKLDILGPPVAPGEMGCPSELLLRMNNFDNGLFDLALQRADNFLVHGSILAKLVIALKQLPPSIFGHVEFLYIFAASGDDDQSANQFLFVFIGQQLIAKMLFVIGNPRRCNTAPDCNLVLGMYVPHQIDFKLFQRRAEIRANHIEDRPNMLKQLW